MRKITIEPPPERRIEINGVVFDVLLSDVEILDMMGNLIGQCDRLGTGEGIKTEEVTLAITNALETVDKILGEGAAAKILKGRPAGIDFMLKRVISPLLKEVLTLASESYESNIAKEYGVF